MLYGYKQQSQYFLYNKPTVGWVAMIRLCFLAFRISERKLCIFLLDGVNGVPHQLLSALEIFLSLESLYQHVYHWLCFSAAPFLFNILKCSLSEISSKNVWLSVNSLKKGNILFWYYQKVGPNNTHFLFLVSDATKAVICHRHTS